jgi:aspartate racemase
MKTIGLLGGLSWHSTGEYYRIINEETARRLGADRSAPIMIYSVDFGPIQKLQRAGKWADVGHELARGAARVEKAGADFLLLCANTAHEVAPQIEQSVSIPLIHIADAVAEEIQKYGLVSVGLLGTIVTMEHDFYKDRLASRHGLDVIVPKKNDRKAVDRIIYHELCCGKVLESSTNMILQVMNKLENQGAQGIILGCTELPLLIRETDLAVPVFDTTMIHAQKAVSLALGERKV